MLLSWSKAKSHALRLLAFCLAFLSMLYKDLILLLPAEKGNKRRRCNQLCLEEGIQNHSIGTVCTFSHKQAAAGSVGTGKTFHVTLLMLLTGQKSPKTLESNIVLALGSSVHLGFIQ